MPTSSPAMQAAYRRAPSLDTARDIVLRELAVRPGAPQTIITLALAAPEWVAARTRLAREGDPQVTEVQLLDAFQNRLGAAARLLAGTTVRSGTQETPKIRLVGRRKWEILPLPPQDTPTQDAAAADQDLARAAELPPEAIDLHFQAGPAPVPPPRPPSRRSRSRPPSPPRRRSPAART
jgi:hypothetical protein